MLATLITIAIVGGITCFLVFNQGLFSSLIMCVLSLVSALIAFNYYEALGRKLSGFGLEPYGPEAISLMALFLLSLLVLRIAFDRLIDGNMKFPLIVDRIASTLLGFVSGMVIAGVIAIGFQLMPTPTKLLGFDRFPNAADRNLEERNHLFPRVDGFVSSVVGQASMYGFAGDLTYTQYHPDFLAELYLNRVTLDPYSRQSAATNCLKIDTAWVMTQNNILDCRNNELIMPDTGEIFIAVRLHIHAGSESKDDRGAADADRKIRFTLGNIRLLGFDKKDKHAQGISRYPRGILKPGFQIIDGMGYDQGRQFQEGQSRAVDLLFAWPEQYKQITPQWIEFKGSARAVMPSVAKLENEKMPEIQHWFDASRYVAKANFELPDENNVPYNCVSLSVLPSNSIEDQEILKLPQVVESRAEAKKELHYDEVEPTRFQDTHRYLQTHFHIQPNSRKQQNAPSYALFIPQGYHLLYLQITGNQDPISSSFVLPTLIGAQGNTIYAAGMKLEGTIKNKAWTEMAYSARTLDATSHKEAYPRYRNIVFAKKKAAVKTLLVFYLVPQKTLDMGIVGCRTHSNVSDPGKIWNFKDDVDTVRSPSAAKKPI